MSQNIFYDAKSKYKVRVIDMTYRKDKDGSWPARIYLPEGKGPSPALLDVHGGAWSFGGCADNELIDLSLASSGLVVIAVECRKAPHYTYPSQVMDVNYATRWVKAHAEDFNAIPDCIGGFGTSSGGHTLLLSAMRPEDSRYGALHLPEAEGMDTRLSYLIAAWPVIDPYARYLFAKENSRDFLVDATNNYFVCHENMVDGSPLLALERGEDLYLPPALIVQGTDDSNVPLASVDRFAEAYLAAGGEVDIQWYPDMPHGFACKPGAETDNVLKIMKNFISHKLPEIKMP